MILIVSGFYTATAQSNNYQFSHLDISDGLSHNQINCIYKDSKGFMWFGTMSGLNRYDGYTFKVFKHDAGNKNSINDDYIVSIFEGPGQNLWITTRSGICIYNFATEQFSSDISGWFKTLNLPSWNVTKIKKDSDGNFWFICPNSGLCKYTPSNKRTYHYTSDVSLQPTLFSNNVSDIAEDTKGNMWCIYNTGVIEMLDTKLNKITYRSNVLSNIKNAKTLYYSLTIDSDDDLWLYASEGNMGVYYFSPKTNIIRHIDKSSAGARLNANIINNIVQADDGLIWVATDHGGINLIDKKSFKVIYLLTAMVIPNH